MASVEEAHAHGPDDGHNPADFFDEFNKDKDKQALLEEVNRKLCEVLTELAEDIVEGLGEMEAARAAALEAGNEEPLPRVSGAGEGGVDEVAALAAYNDAMAAILREKELSSKDMCGLPDEHPLKELFFSAFDAAMFSDLLRRHIEQVRSRKGGPGEWDAEAAEGECDEDHTLE
ncbi:hypothetical protein HYH03_005975 [Edaphochlamys debaryana]|uniref:Uncharacterized protein n=1 Tax=Edaphochlamys debaryana TaxID=47281 RepID=A0A835Y8B4_9CHLO|nr:hypothetical protein HYH03_005975 [Edaphochlamys debaryana]|eukprot:KAG2496056.1 hypothetical protein HYH03_005975 [Edaphochlamys debaryana]